MLYEVLCYLLFIDLIIFVIPIALDGLLFILLDESRDDQMIDVSRFVVVTDARCVDCMTRSPSSFSHYQLNCQSYSQLD